MAVSPWLSAIDVVLLVWFFVEVLQHLGNNFTIINTNQSIKNCIISILIYSTIIFNFQPLFKGVLTLSLNALASA